MAGLKLKNEDKQNLIIVKSMLELLGYWRELIKEPCANSIFTTDELKNNIALVERMIQNSELSELEVNIINDGLINRKYNMEKVGTKYNFSDSGIRNKVDSILKKIADRNL